MRRFALVTSVPVSEAPEIPLRTRTRLAALMALIATLIHPSGAQAQSCPERVRFEPTANGTLDAGWTGNFHRMDILGSTLDVTIACPSSTPPCGACEITGLTPTSTAAWHRCADDTSLACTVANEVADCGAPGTCRTYLSPPVSIGTGLPLCYTAYVSGPVVGTVYPDEGAFSPRVPISGDIRVGVFAPIFGGGPNQGCPRCVGDAAANDGVRGGTCDTGPRAGMSCDANGTSALQDFGSTSFDCPHVADVSTVPFVLGPIDAHAGDSGMNVNVGSTLCGADPTHLCLCATCNTAAAEACATSIDCPPSVGNIVGVCNGKRCLGGANNGTPCAASSECSGGGICGRPGEPSKPNACNDDPETPEVDGCVDIGGANGECSAGPVSLACSNHPNRACTDDQDCDDVADACIALLRPCFLDNGFPPGEVFVGGAVTTPVAGISEPSDVTSIACLRPTNSSSYNAAFGLPGLARIHLPGRLRIGDAVDATTTVTPIVGTTPTVTPIVGTTPSPTIAPTPLPDPCPSNAAACRAPFLVGKSSLQITNKSPDDKDQLAWKWSHGAATALGEFGYPTTSDAYALCLYDAGALVATMRIPAAGTCGGKPCWKAKTNGFTFRSKTADPHGITQVTLKAGVNGKAQIQVKGKGSLLPLPAVATLTSTLEMQLRNRASGLCWGTTFVPPFDTVTTTLLKDKAD